MVREIETTAKAMTSAEEEFFGAELFYCVAKFDGDCVRLRHRGRKGLSGCGEYRPSGSFDCADHDKAVICFAQDDGDYWLKGTSGVGIGHLRGPFGKLRAGSSTAQLARCASSR